MENTDCDLYIVIKWGRSHSARYFITFSMRILVNPVREWVGMRIEVSGALPTVNLRSAPDLLRRGRGGVQTIRASLVSLLARGGFLQQSADMPTWPARGEINIMPWLSARYDFLCLHVFIICWLRQLKKCKSQTSSFWLRALSGLSDVFLSARRADRA